MKKYYKISVVFCILIATILCCEKDETTNSYEIKYEKTFGGRTDEFGHDVVKINENESLILGTTYKNGYDNSDILLIKINQNADTLWTKILGTKSHDFVYNFVPTNDGDYIIFLRSFDTKEHILLIKINPNGEIIWQKNYHGHASHMIKTNDGGYAILDMIGSSEINVVYNQHYAEASIIKLDANGDSLWSRTCGTFEINSSSFIQNSKNNFVIIGKLTDTVSHETKLAMTVTNANGEPILNKTFSMGISVSAITIIEAINDGYIVMYTTKEEGSDTESLLLTRLDSEANIKWESRKKGIIYGNKIISTNNKYYIVGTEYYTGDIPQTIYIGEMDQEGNIRKLKNNSNLYGDSGESIIYLSNKELAIVGSTRRNSNGYFDVYYLVLEY